MNDANRQNKSKIVSKIQRKIKKINIMNTDEI